MAETLYWEPGEDEDEKNITLEIEDSKEIVLTRQNSAVWKYLGNLAIYNHVHYVDDSGDGTHIFQTTECYEELVQAMEEAEYPRHLGQQVVSEEIIDYFNGHVANDLIELDAFPREWGISDTEVA